MSDLDPPSDAPGTAAPSVEMTSTSEVVGAEHVTTVHYKLAGQDVGLTLEIRGPAPSTTRYVAWEWPRSAPDPTGPADPPAAALAIAPDLVEVLRSISEPELPSPRRDDWPVNATIAELRVVESDEWTEADTEHVRGAITDDVDAYVSALIDRWLGLWPELTWEPKFRGRFPGFVAELTERYRNDRRYSRKREAHRTKWLERATTVGLWDVYRTRHPWPDYTARDCVVCGRRFPPESRFGAELDFGPPIACKACVRRAMAGHQLTTVDVRGLLRTLAERFGFPPPSAFRQKRDAFAVSGRQADLLALFVALPTSDACGEALGIPTGPGRWLAVLQEVGLIGEAWRMPRGVLTMASDGHLCRSFGELAIERFLIASGIEHKCEPVYPTHPEFNVNGKLRADWLLPGDRWIEYAGMMEEKEYAARMGAKVELAALCGIDLLVVTPEDLHRLGEVLGIE